MVTFFKIIFFSMLLFGFSGMVLVIGDLRDELSLATSSQRSLDQKRQRAEELAAQERQKAEALSRDLEAARAEVAALKPQAAARASLSQERRSADQCEPELQQERQKAEALTRELAAARAEVAALRHGPKSPP